MKKVSIKDLIILICIVVLTVFTNITYKKQYIKSVSGKTNYDYVLSASQLDMKLGSIFSVYATGNDASKVTWYSSNQNVAVINSFGQVIAKNPGQTIITAKYKKECKDMIVNVNKNAKQDVLIYKDSTTVAAATEVLNKININTFILTLSKNKYKYNGKKKQPKVTITSTDHTKLILNKDYTIKYQHNKNAGTAQVIVTGIGDYTGSLVGTFIIEKSSEDSAMTPITNTQNTSESNTESQSNSLNSSNSASSLTSTSSLTPTSPENSKVSSTRSKTYTSSSSTSNKKTTTSSSSSTPSSKKQTSKSSSTSETTKNSFTTSKNSTSKNSFTKSPNSSTSKKNSSSSSNTSSNESPSDTNSSDSNTSSDTSSTNSSTSGQSSTDSTNQSSQSTDSTTSTTTE